MLNIVYNFRETCIKSDSIRKFQLEKLDKDDSKDVQSVKTEAETSIKEDSYPNIKIDGNCSAVDANWSIKNSDYGKIQAFLLVVELQQDLHVSKPILLTIMAAAIVLSL